MKRFSRTRKKSLVRFRSRTLNQVTIFLSFSLIFLDQIEAGRLASGGSNEIESPSGSNQVGFIKQTSSQAANHQLPLNDEPANDEKPFASMMNSAVINGKVSLPCDISPANADDSVALILWYKDDSLAPIYTIDARRASSLDRAKISLDDAYANRSMFNMKLRPAQLQLEPIKQEDEGEYRCRVDFKKGRTVNTIIGLKVIESPKNISIYSGYSGSRRLQGLVGPFDEGSELVLNCVTSGGKPRPQIIWKRDFNVVDESYQHLDKEGTSNELKIPSLNKNHLLSIFTCQASNSNLTSPLQTSIKLDLNLKPQEISLKQLVQEPLVVGQSATFECSSHGSKPQATIYWLFQGVRHETPMNVDQQQTSSRLTLVLQRSFNQQSLTCVAENPKILAQNSIQQTLKLDVQYPPQLQIKLEPSGSAEAETEAASTSSYLQEGNDIYLTCSLSSNPRPLKPILWRFNGKLLSSSLPVQQQQQTAFGNQPNQNMMIVMNNQSLVLRKVSRFQSGSYSCEASNSLGSNSSKPIELNIKHAPVCATDDILVYEAILGQVVKIDCNVIANPSKSVHFSWFVARNEANLSQWLRREAGQDEQIDESSSRLKYKIRDSSSYGYFKCKAKNEIGLQQRACLFQIIPAQPSIPPLRHSCSLLNASSSNLQIGCQLSQLLKSEERDLIDPQSGSRQDQPPHRASGGGGGLDAWLNLEALRAGGGGAPAAPAASLANGADSLANGEQPAASAQVNLRLVYPPNWLLTELYKLAPASREQESETSMGSQRAELTAYVIVGPAAQLTTIKTLVEENQLLSSNPKSVYYVPAKANSSQSEVHPAAKLHPALKYSDSPQLGDNFNFTIPNLEPEQKYKLLIFSQSLANKTRDFFVIKATTLSEDSLITQPGNSRSQLAEEPRDSSASGKEEGNLNLMDQQQSFVNDLATETQQQQQQQQQQKSIVMRSDNNQQQPNSSGDMSENNSLSYRNGSSVRNNSQFLSSQLLLVANGADFGKLMEFKLQQFNLYKDYAISLAKQKPILALATTITSLSLIIMALIWVSNLFVKLARGGSGRVRANVEGGATSGGAQSDSPTPRKNSTIDRKSSIEKDKSIFAISKSSSKFDELHLSSYNSSTNSQFEAPTTNNSSPETPLAAGLNGLRHANCSGAIVDQMISNQQQVYAISAANNFTLQPGEIFQAQLKQPFEANYFGGSIRAGSLDRREMFHHQNEQQAIYVTDANRLLGLNAHTFNSIDRRANGASGGKHGHQLYTDLGANAIYLPASGQHASDCNFNQNQLANSFSSSNECNTSSDTQPTCNQMRQLRARGQQRVAFDLGEREQQKRRRHQQLHEQTGNCLRFLDQNFQAEVEAEEAEALRRHQHHHIVLSPILIGDEDPRGDFRGEAQQLCGEQPQLLQHGYGVVTKGSDSGGSNSGNTADSGHESPSVLNNSAKQQRAEPGVRTLLLSGSSLCSSPNDLQVIGPTNGLNCPRSGGGNQGAAYRLGVQQPQRRDGQRTRPIMLIELSPGSQESSTLLQSVDSSSLANYAEQQFQAQRQLEANHEMATSFTSTGNTNCD